MPTLDLVLPLRAIVLQGLFLAIAVAIEAIVIYNQLGISKPGSVQYSFALNLASTVLGWMLFLTLEPLLPQDWRLATISFVFFNQFFGQFNSGASLSVLAFLVFLGTFFAELQMMNLLIKLWSPPEGPVQHDTTRIKNDRTQRYRSSQTSRYRSSALLRANSYSYGVILLLLIVLQRARFL